MRIALGHLQPGLLKGTLQYAGRHFIGVQDRDKAKDRGADDRGQQELGPDRFHRKAVFHLVAPRGIKPVERTQQGEPADDPRSGRAKRAVDAAEFLKGLVQRSDGLAAGDVPRDVAPDEQPAQRHDKGRNGKVADEIAVKRPDHEAGKQPDTDGDPRDQRMTELQPQRIRQPVGLGHRHHRRTGRQQRAHRQVDMSGDDDEHHAGRHDRDTHGLNRQVENVARGQETPVGQHVENQTDGDESTDHAQQAQVDFQRVKDVLARRSPAAVGVCLSHESGPEKRNGLTPC